jgi:hypothetical protein
MCQSMPCNGSQTTTNQPTTNTNNTNRSTTNNNKTREGSNKRTRCARLGLGLRLEDRLVLCSNIQCEHINQHHDYVAEWLRRWPRKPFRETGRRFKSCRSRLFFVGLPSFFVSHPHHSLVTLLRFTTITTTPCCLDSLPLFLL